MVDPADLPRSTAESSGYKATTRHAEVLAFGKAMVEAQIDKESDPYFATARLWDDGIIDPRDTRRILGLCLAMAVEADGRTLHPNTFGVARM